MRRRTVLRTIAAGALLAPVAAPTAAAARVPAAGPEPAVVDTPGLVEAPAPAGPGTGAALQQLTQALQQAGIPGVFGEARDGEQVWPLAAGVADTGTGRPVRPGFQHRVASITKTFVATTVLQLVGERRVALDTPIGRYLPDVVPGQRGRQVTVRMLLNHTSGISDHVGGLLASAEDLIRASGHTFTARDLVTVGLIRPPTGAPGTTYAYSNTNYVILGLLIERLTRRSYAAEITRRILRPLGLRQTYFPGTETRIRGEHSLGYLPWDQGELRDFSVFNMTWVGAAGDLVSTAADLNVFFRALLSGRLLRPALLAEMKTTVPMSPDHPEHGGYGLGLFWLPTPCGRAWGHNGLVPGHATFSYHSEDGLRQITTAENLTYHSPDLAQQIGQARYALQMTALCGPGPTARRAAATPIVPPTDSNLALHRLTR